MSAAIGVFFAYLAVCFLLGRIMSLKAEVHRLRQELDLTSRTAEVRGEVIARQFHELEGKS